MCFAFLNLNLFPRKKKRFSKTKLKNLFVKIVDGEHSIGVVVSTSKERDFRVVIWSRLASSRSFSPMISPWFIPVGGDNTAQLGTIAYSELKKIIENVPLKCCCKYILISLLSFFYANQSPSSIAREIKEILDSRSIWILYRLIRMFKECLACLRRRFYHKSDKFLHTIFIMNQLRVFFHRQTWRTWMEKINVLYESGTWCFRLQINQWDNC